MPNVDNDSIFKISYGLFVLTAKDQNDNGCIINTVQQVTQEPLRISITVNKANFTCEMIRKTGKFNVSVLTEGVPFEIFQRFGFKSGKNTDKFADFADTKRTENGVLYLTKYVNAVISGKVTKEVDLGTHILFVADVTEAIKLSNENSVTYDYYFKHIKPKPEAQKKKGYVCKICGYVYEGDELPDDFICPLCKHGAADFEPIS